MEDLELIRSEAQRLTSQENINCYEDDRYFITELLPEYYNTSYPVWIDPAIKDLWLRV